MELWRFEEGNFIEFNPVWMPNGHDHVSIHIDRYFHCTPENVTTKNHTYFTFFGCEMKFMTVLTRWSLRAKFIWFDFNLICLPTVYFGNTKVLSMFLCMEFSVVNFRVEIKWREFHSWFQDKFILQRHYWAVKKKECEKIYCKKVKSKLTEA